METLRNILRPGKDQEDEILYGSGEAHDSHKGEIAGEGSHFPTSTSNQPKSAVASGHKSYEGSTGRVGATQQPTNTSTISSGTQISAPFRPKYLAGPDSTASIKSGIQGYPQKKESHIPLTGGPQIEPSHVTQNVEPREDSSSGYTAGQYSSNLANKVDPRVDSDRDDHIVGTGYEETSTERSTNGQGIPDRTIRNQHSLRNDNSSSNTSHLGREIGSGAAAIGVAETIHHHREYNAEEAKREDSGIATVGTTTTNWSYPLASGTTVSSTKPYSSHDNVSATNTRYGSSMVSTTTEGHGHLGRDAAIGAGALGAAGLAGHEYRKDHDNATATGLDGQGHRVESLEAKPHDKDSRDQIEGDSGNNDAQSVHNPHNRGTVYRSDSNTDPTSHMPGAFVLTPGDERKNYSYPYTTSSVDERTNQSQPEAFQTSAGPRYENAGLVGAGGLAAYEASKHQNRNQPIANDPSDPDYRFRTMQSEPQSAVQGKSGNDHHYSRDAGLAGAGAAAAYGIADHHHHNEPPKVEPNEAVYFRARETEPTFIPAAQDPSHENHNARNSGIAGLAGAGGTAYTANQYDKQRVETRYVPGKTRIGEEPTQSTQEDHHYGRDAGLAGAGIGVGGIAAYEANKHHHHHENDPRSEDGSPTKQDPHDHSMVKNAALVGGAGAAAGIEYSKHDAAKEAKEQRKQFERQQKELEKQHAKELKAQEKERSREEKAQEKGLEIQHDKDLKAQEKGQAREEKARQKSLEEKERQESIDKEEKEETGRKKRHSFFSFFHRDKSPKDEEKEEHLDQEEVEGAAGVGAAAAVEDAHEHGKHDRNRLHKDPPAERLSDDGEKNVVIEPSTGLPMNVGKYGTGEGGTDAGPIHGYQQE
ncbi:MAG: hypothetical protein M1834_005977 [Cirrosporium novae-zelandiae]|nr:MAG: hypothetical protein M1834_005977 [Cirrosporium novae-zelandiae]